MNPRTFVQAVSLETRTQLSYRADFWTNFLLGVITFVVANYVLWRAVFLSRGSDRIGGYTLPDMVLYVLLTACVMRVSFGPMRGDISQEIYTGGINKYLVYPVSFHAFKYAGHLAYSLVSLAQMGLALALALPLVGLEPFARVSPHMAFIGVVASLLAGYLYFVFNALMEMVSFWAENVWSLSVLLRFATLFLGGGLAPLALFPEWAQDAVRYTPFPYVLSFPVRCLQGLATESEVVFSFAVMAGWIAVGCALFAFMFRRGLRTYSGVGI